MSNLPVKMEVDNPVLKRSSSAPMINELTSSMTSSTHTATTSRESPPPMLFAGVAPRTRRFSASSLSPAVVGVASVSRVDQLRREECLDVAVGRETAHERELNSTMVMSQSWEDLTIVGTSPKAESGGSSGGRVGVCDPLHLHLPGLPPLCSSPSPTRALNAKQLFSPTLFTRANLSPSPTRKFTTRRSLSPIAMRPSTLCPMKRKFELEDGEQAPAAKRHSVGLLMPHSHSHSSSGSPLGAGGSLSSSVGTPESVSSGDSPGYSPAPPSAAPHTDHPMRDLTKAS